MLGRTQLDQELHSDQDQERELDQELHSDQDQELRWIRNYTRIRISIRIRNYAWIRSAAGGKHC